jgi:4'-phosphopantetheinyl transferase
MDLHQSQENFMQSLNWLSISGQRQHFAWFSDDGTISLANATKELSQAEQNKANQLKNAEEMRHFVLRRAFQRCFTKSVTEFEGPLCDVPLIHVQDSPPLCTHAPNLSLSFSSSGPIAVAVASFESKIGVDIEFMRPVDNAPALAKRFFNEREASYLSKLSPDASSAEFLKFWTIKEACLKAAGQGIVYGPEKFTIDDAYRVEPPLEFGTKESWNIISPIISVNHLVTVAFYTPFGSV